MNGMSFMSISFRAQGDVHDIADRVMGVEFLADDVGHVVTDLGSDHALSEALAGGGLILGEVTAVMALIRLSADLDEMDARW